MECKAFILFRQKIKQKYNTLYVKISYKVTHFLPSFCNSFNLFFRTASSDKSSARRLIPISILLCALCRSFLELCFLDRSSLKSLLPSSTLSSAILIPFSICDRELLTLSTSLTFFCLVSSSFS